MFHSPKKNIKKIAGLDILILGRLLLTCPEFSGIFGNDPLAKYPKKKKQPPATPSNPSSNPTFSTNKMIYPDGPLKPP